MKDLIYFLKLNAPVCPGCRLDLEPEGLHWVCSRPWCTESESSVPILSIELERAHRDVQAEERATA